MAYRIWFKVDGFEEIELPVNPQEVAISYPANPTNYDVEGLGDIVIPRIPKLATMSFESFFPRQMLYQSVVNSDKWYTPEWYVTFFRKLQRDRTPFELTIVRGSDNLREYDQYGNSYLNKTDYFDTVFPKAVVLDLTFTDKGGEPGDVYYSMMISEYRDASPQKMAELASEEYDNDGNVLSQKMVMAVNRPAQTGAIVTNTPIQVNGEVYETPDQTQTDWRDNVRKVTNKINQVDRIVSRVLPPSVSGQLHSIYISGLGWVDKASCSINTNGGLINVNGIQG
jgi:hypothetical protein